MGSTRLPGKVLRDVAGRSLLGRVLDRTRRVSGKLPVVIATSRLRDDDPIAAFADEENTEIFRGDRDDVLQRAIDCANAHGFTRMARICGDRPFLDPTLIEQLLERQSTQDLDLATNVLKPTFPKGMATEIIAVRALERIAHGKTTPPDHEHVTHFIYQNPRQFGIFNLTSEDHSMSALNLAVDTEIDFARANWIASHLREPATATFTEIVTLAQRWEQEKSATSVLKS